MRTRLAALLLVLLAGCASLSERAAGSLARDDLRGVRWGLFVATLDGRELAALNPDQRFLPGSNTKLFTAAAAFHRLRGVDQPDPAYGTSLRLRPREAGSPPDLVLAGGGDALLRDSPDCQRDCLSMLADAALANRLASVGDIIADETLFPEEPWGPGWSWDDMVTRSGAAVSALTVNDNELSLVITPAERPGDPAGVAWAPEDAAIATKVLDIDNALVSRAPAEGVETAYAVERMPDSRSVRIYGQVLTTSEARRLRIAAPRPAEIAGLRLRRLLEDRGVRVEGSVRIRSRPAAGLSAAPAGEFEIARLLPPPLSEDLRLLLKESQNLHAELLLRRLGRIDGDGSAGAGLGVVYAMLEEAGAPAWAFDLFDGSGMSVYNRLTPRLTTGFLVWAARQPWGAAFREALPVGGVDGSLRRRFQGTPLEGRIFAKTGTLTGVNALSGYLVARSGQVLVFSAFANERPGGAPSALPALDAALVEIAQTN